MVAVSQLSLADAYKLTQVLLGRDSDDPSYPWRLQEFKDGWLIVDLPLKQACHIDEPVRVIEKTGQVLCFPSSVSSQDVLERYRQVKHLARGC